ncbi:MAG: D-alanyl-D-alanine carboxypeptidase/D-alanyl-D-alanine-endopeptidase, partial [Polyangiaceae bacterium]|nr:D-alanyl-D-alanine carboxypeptidase/D-alanyl-D-alanine-endopeptidase [Polyangiaceae bacterium]
LCASAWFFALAPGEAQHSGTEALAARIADVIRQANLGDRLGVSVVDARTGREIFSLRGDLALNPASNMKVVTAAAALRQLGPSFSMLTGVYGRIENGRVEHLVLRGFGDPSLDLADLHALASELAESGVRSVGTIHVDGSYFDDHLLPPAFEQQPNEVAPFRAAIAAVSVDASSYLLRVLPGAQVGAPARVRLEGEGYFELDNAVTTSESGAPNVIAIQSPIDNGRRMSLRLRGTIPAGSLRVTYRRRTENPLAHAGYLFADALRYAEIGGQRSVSIGKHDEGLPLLAFHRSPALSYLLYRVGKNSDNYVAEMVLKVLGAERRRPGRSETGTEVLQELLARAGVPQGGATIVNGSGLFQGNRIAAGHLTKLLAHVYQDSAMRDEYLAHLAVGGVDGTLERRLGNLPAARIVRAKTGTLNDVVSLSGFVLGANPGEAIAFSFLANGVAGRQSEARLAADAMV